MEEEIIKQIDPERSDWHCYDTLKNLLAKNNEFQETILKGLKEGKISGFGEELFEKLDRQNLRAPGVKSFLEVLQAGYNQGYCTVASKQVSYSLNRCYICGGVLPILAGTQNCQDGSHTWIEHEGYIIDTTLMLIISNQYKDMIGYVEQNRYDPNVDPIYQSTKEFTNDASLKSKH